MAGGFNIFQSALGQGLFRGAAGDYMRRPASNTNLPRTMASNLMERMAARPQTTFTGMSPGTGGGMAPGTGGGTRPGSPQSYVGNGGGAPRPQYETTPAAPNLQRFVPFTGAQGQDMRGEFGGGGEGGAKGWFGGFDPQSLYAALVQRGQAGQYRTPLATLFPAFQGNGPRNSAVRDYFSGPVQPSFQEQFGHLQ